MRASDVLFLLFVLLATLLSPCLSAYTQLNSTDACTLAPDVTAEVLLASADASGETLYTLTTLVQFADVESPGCGVLTSAVWMRFTSPVTGTLTITTCDELTDLDTLLVVAASCDLEADELDCADDECELQSQVSIAVDEDHTYYIAVGGYDTAGLAALSFELVVDCPVGAFRSGVTTCDSCAAGTYSSTAGPETECSLCPAGTASSVVGATAASTCVACMLGTYCPEGAVAPVLCPAGFYCANPTSATPCPAGSFSNATNATSADTCSACSRGAYCPPASTTSSPCPAGYFCEDPSASSPCPAGSFSNATNATSADTCSACSLGAYCPPASTTSSPCPAGYYCEDASTTTPCPAGSFSNATGATSQATCSPCTRGASCPAASSSPTPCAHGFWQNSTGASTCHKCPHNHFSNVTGAESPAACVRCPRHLISLAGSAECVESIDSLILRGVNVFRLQSRPLALSDDGRFLAVGEASQSEPGLTAGRVLLFKRADDYSWASDGELSIGIPAALFGFSTQLTGDGDMLAASAPFVNLQTGAVYIYQRDHLGQLVQTSTITASDAVSHRCGYSTGLASTGLVLAVGCLPTDSGDSGRVYMFSRSTRDATAPWTEFRLVPDSLSGGEEFGVVIDVTRSADLVVVGARVQAVGAMQHAGAVFVFARSSPTEWEQVTRLNAPEPDAYSSFGSYVEVSADGGLIAVAAISDDTAGLSAGAVHVYQASSSTSWNHTAKLIAPSARSYDLWGSSLDLRGDVLAVGARGNLGRAFVLARDGNDWITSATLSDEEDAGFGRSVQLSGDTTVMAVMDDLEEEQGVFIFACPPGGYLGDNANTCQACPPGSVCEHTFGIVPCPAGTYSPRYAETSASACVTCPAGSFCPQGSPAPLLCPPSTWQSAAGSERCIPCDANAFSSATGATNASACATCPEGQINLPGQPVCVDSIPVTFLSPLEVLETQQNAVAMSVSGDVVVFGTPKEGFYHDAGSVLVFERLPDNSWDEGTVLAPVDGTANDFFGFSVSASSDATTLAISAPLVTRGELNSGAVYVFRRDGSEAHQQVAKLFTSVEHEEEVCGLSVVVSSDGTVVVAGCPGYVDSTGRAVIFEEVDPNSWMQTQVLPKDLFAGSQFGIDADMAGKDPSTGTRLLAISSNAGWSGDLEAAGLVYVVRYVADQDPEIVATLESPHPAVHGAFGNMVRLTSDGSVLVVSEIGDSTVAVNSGAVHIFTLGDADLWEYTMSLHPASSSAIDAESFGKSLSISPDGSTLAIGATGSGGRVEFFTRDSPTEWLKSAVVAAKLDNAYGRCVTLSGDGMSVAVMATLTADSVAGMIISCPPGASLNGDSTECRACPAGSACPFLYGTVPCPAGSYSPVNRATSLSVCRPCPIGAFCPEGSANPIPCPPGTWQDSGSSLICKPCPANTFSNTTGATSVSLCTACPPGNFSVRGQDSCVSTRSYFLDGDIDGAFTELDGHTMTMSEDGLVAALGAFNTDVRAGSVVMFISENGQWRRATVLHASDAKEADLFGGALAMSSDGGLLLIGAFGADRAGVEEAGIAYVFVRTGPDSWREVAKLGSSNPLFNDFFGSAVSMTRNGSAMAISTIEQDYAGSTFIFERTGLHEWTEMAVLRGDSSGFGVAPKLSGDGTLLLVGGAAALDTDPHGVVYIFERRSAHEWRSVQNLTSPNQLSGASFASSLATTPGFGVIVVGAAKEDVTRSGTESGAVHVFREVEVGARSWAQVATLVSATVPASSDFGGAVAVTTDASVIVVSAMTDSSQAFSSGSVIFFVAADALPNAWLETAKLTPWDAGALHTFGVDMSISADGTTVGVRDARRLTTTGGLYVIACPLGSYASSDRQSCAPCPAGHICKNPFTTSPCPSGTYNPQEAAASSDACLPCPTGSFCPVGSVTPNPCRPGTYQDEPRSTACKACPAGAFVDSEGSTSASACVPCPVDLFSMSGASCVSSVGFGTMVDLHGRRNDLYGMSVALSGTAEVAAIGAPRNDLNARNGGSVAIWRRDGRTSQWALDIQWYVASASTNADFGFDVALSQDGTTLVVGVPGDHQWGADSGAVSVFLQTSDSWTNAAILRPSNPASDDRFGNAVSVSSDAGTIVVGARGHIELLGVVYVFERIGTSTWVETATLYESGTSDFGSALAVSADGTRTLVGAVGTNDNRGAAFIFVKDDDGHWSELWDLVTNDTARVNDEFGNSVALEPSNSVYAVSAIGRDDYSGAVFLFVIEGDEVFEGSELHAPDSAPLDEFGSSIALSSRGEVVIVGARSANMGLLTDSGSVYVWTRVGQLNQWEYVRRITSPQAGVREYFGHDVAVSVDGGVVLIGAEQGDQYAESAGSALILPCPRGSYANDTAARCEACPRGYVCPSPFTIEPCPSHTFNNVTGATSLDACKTCPRGSYCPESGTGFPIPCEAGTFQSATGSTVCHLCDRGKYNEHVGSSSEGECVACPGGTANNMTGAAAAEACAACAPGTSAPAGSSVCSECAVGRFSVSAGASECIACAPGFTAAEGASVCALCEVGKYTADASRAPCASCPDGEFSNGLNGTHPGVCVAACPAGSVVVRDSACVLQTCQYVNASGTCLLTAEQFCANEPCISGIDTLGSGFDLRTGRVGSAPVQVVLFHRAVQPANALARSLSGVEESAAVYSSLFALSESSARRVGVTDASSQAVLFSDETAPAENALRQSKVVGLSSVLVRRAEYELADTSLSHGFATAVSALPVAYDRSVYSAFVREHGTHYVRSVIVGAQVGVQAFVDSCYFGTDDEQCLKKSLGLDLERLTGIGTLSSVDAANNCLNTSLQTSRHSSGFVETVVGGDRNELGDWARYVESVDALPAVVAMEVRELASLVEDATKREHVSRAVEEYLAGSERGQDVTVETAREAVQGLARCEDAVADGKSEFLLFASGGLLLIVILLLVIIAVIVVAGIRKRSAVRISDEERAKLRIPSDTLHGLGEAVGSGKFGSVRRAQYLGANVVVKQFHGEASSTAQTQALIDEAVLLSRLDHPHVPRCMGYVQGRAGDGSDNGDLLIVMSDAGRVSLERVLCMSGSMVPEDSDDDSSDDEDLVPFGSRDRFFVVVKILRDVASALTYMHNDTNRGYIVVHNDVAARNVVLSTKDGEVVAQLADLGLATVMRTASSEPSKIQATVPVPFQQIAPETLTTLTVSPKTDVWQFGCLVWEALSRDKPFPQHRTPMLVRDALVGGATPDAGGAIKSYSNAEIEQIMRDCWSHDPDARPSMGEVLHRLDELLARLEVRGVADLTAELQDAAKQRSTLSLNNVYDTVPDNYMEIERAGSSYMTLPEMGVEMGAVVVQSVRAGWSDEEGGTGKEVFMGDSDEEHSDEELEVWKDSV